MSRANGKHHAFSLIAQKHGALQHAQTRCGRADRPPHDGGALDIVGREVARDAAKHVCGARGQRVQRADQQTQVGRERLEADAALVAQQLIEDLVKRRRRRVHVDGRDLIFGEQFIATVTTRAQHEVASRTLRIIYVHAQRLTRLVRSIEIERSVLHALGKRQYGRAVEADDRVHIVAALGRNVHHTRAGLGHLAIEKRERRHGRRDQTLQCCIHRISIDFVRAGERVIERSDRVGGNRSLETRAHCSHRGGTCLTW